uniref:Uncharacterized protein n=1 Tax=uncultured marine crenarchaeote HF4000_APKG2O16 TaxID=455582 RepID=B3T6X1_9ARCH|nr:hypothetical protein ALOHA_HF4000APKG2O16ctg9g8 [uncultured marine crenarchaeote HF4000_APKG2O16]
MGFDSKLSCSWMSIKLIFLIVLAIIIVLVFAFLLMISIFGIPTEFTNRLYDICRAFATFLDYPC